MTEMMSAVDPLSPLVHENVVIALSPSGLAEPEDPGPEAAALSVLLLFN
jgi:hypothetical protein